MIYLSKSSYLCCTPYCCPIRSLATDTRVINTSTTFGTWAKRKDRHNCYTYSNQRNQHLWSQYIYKVGKTHRISKKKSKALSRSYVRLDFCCLSGGFYRRVVPTRSQIQLGHIAGWVYVIVSIYAICFYSCPHHRVHRSLTLSDMPMDTCLIRLPNPIFGQSFFTRQMPLVPMDKQQSS